MLNVDKSNFDEKVIQAEKVVMVDFYSPKCEPCKELMPSIVELAEKYTDQMDFYKLDISENRRLAIGQRVMGLPTMVFYRGGEKIATLTGDDLTAEMIEEEIQKYI